MIRKNEGERQGDRGGRRKRGREIARGERETERVCVQGRGGGRREGGGARESGGGRETESERDCTRERREVCTLVY